MAQAVPAGIPDHNDHWELVGDREGAFLLFLNGNLVARGGRDELLGWVCQRAEVAFGVPRALRRRRG